ncbi:hypothetical protein BDZ97DRAFT_2057777 [Flammula alnicola]|nr:hypothetical protein BDZ97DRAFT_2057777 [Flammula alnicola]
MSLKLVSARCEINMLRRVFVAAVNRILVILVLMGIGRARVREKTARPVDTSARANVAVAGVAIEISSKFIQTPIHVSGSNDTPLGLFTRLPGWIAGMRMTWAVPDVGCEGKTSSRFVLISKEWSLTQLYAAIQLRACRVTCMQALSLIFLILEDAFHAPLVILFLALWEFPQFTDGGFAMFESFGEKRDVGKEQLHRLGCSGFTMCTLKWLADVNSL